MGTPLIAFTDRDRRELTDRLERRETLRALAPRATRVVQDDTPHQASFFDVVVSTGPDSHQVVDSLPIAPFRAGRVSVVVRGAIEHIRKTYPGKRVVAAAPADFLPRRRQVIAPRKAGLTYEEIDAMFGTSVAGVTPGQERLVEKGVGAVTPWVSGDKTYSVGSQIELDGVTFIPTHGLDIELSDGCLGCGYAPAKCRCGDPLDDTRAREQEHYDGFGQDRDERDERLREDYAHWATRYRRAIARHTLASDPLAWLAHERRGITARLIRVQRDWASTRTLMYELSGAALGVAAESLEALRRREYGLGRALEELTYDDTAALAALADAHVAQERLAAILDELFADLDPAECTAMAPLDPEKTNLPVPPRQADPRLRVLMAQRDRLVAAGKVVAAARVSRHLAALRSPAITADLAWADAYRRADAYYQYLLLRAAGRELEARALAAGVRADG